LFKSIININNAVVLTASTTSSITISYTYKRILILAANAIFIKRWQMGTQSNSPVAYRVLA